MAGYAHDYVSGHETGLHHHPRAQLLFATAGVMRIATEPASFTVPPGTGLWVPANTLHAVRMDGAVRMHQWPSASWNSLPRSRNHDDAKGSSQSMKTTPPTAVSARRPPCSQRAPERC